MALSFVCVNCSNTCTPNPRLKGNQSYCGEPPCQRARKAAWKRRKLASDPDYRATQSLSNRKWNENNRGYWREYRKRNPAKAERNRILQRRRNESYQKGTSPPVIAKVDALGNLKSQLFQGHDQFWLVPSIAKVDALRVRITVIPG